MAGKRFFRCEYTGPRELIGPHLNRPLCTAFRFHTQNPIISQKKIYRFSGESILNSLVGHVIVSTTVFPRHIKHYKTRHILPL